jgi:DNA helicase II / ATP-dependent DNA helicase PcrA
MTMNDYELIDMFEKLSPIQKKVVEWGESPLMVLAGPGSGKTRVLTCRIAKILNNTKDQKFRILGLTFTNKAADEMRTRVASMVPGEEKRVFLGTFHSFCADVLRQHGTYLKINPNFKIYSQTSDLLAVLSDAVEKIKHSSGIISNLDKKTLPIIDRLKANIVFPDQCSEVFRDKNISERMALVYPAYEKELSDRNSLDFNSLIMRAYELFIKFPALAKRYRTVYPYICIDEFQDTNSAQYNLIKAIAGTDFQNIFVVADDDQIIYQWNGASHKRLVEFRNEFSPTIIQLPMNYRCPPEIVELANNLIQHNFLRSKDKKPLEAFIPSSDKNVVRLLGPFENFEAEMQSVALDIKKHYFSELGKTIVLARSRKLLEGAQRAFEKISIRAIISQRKDEFVSSPFVWLHSILRLSNDRQDRNSLEAVCGSFSQLTGCVTDVEEIVSQADATNHDYLQNWAKISGKSTDNPSALSIIEQANKHIIENRDFFKFSNLSLDWFDKIIDKNKEIKADYELETFSRFNEEALVWNELMKSIRSSLGEDLTLEAFLQELQMHSKEPPAEPNSLSLMTIHGAKGKEFDNVYLIGLVDDELPSFQSKKKGDDSPEMEEERRNCFVAITRTMKTLTLSYALKYRGWQKKPSRFLYEMGLLT